MQVKENSENRNGSFSAVPQPGSSHSVVNSCTGTAQKKVKGWDKVAKPPPLLPRKTLPELLSGCSHGLFLMVCLQGLFQGKISPSGLSRISEASINTPRHV